MIDDAERNRLILRYSYIVTYNASRLCSALPSSIDVGDMESAGTFGLMDAIRAFDPSRGVKFETYCATRIRGAMLDELRAMDWVPRLVRAKAAKLLAARQQLEEKLGRPATNDELADHLKMGLGDLESLCVEANAVGIMSLDKKWYETDSYKDVREIDVLLDKKGEDPSCGERRLEQMRKVMAGCNKNERILLIGYYYEDLTMKEIGEQIGLSESRVSQMHADLMLRLKSRLSKAE